MSWCVAWPSLTDGGWHFNPVYKHFFAYCLNVFSNFFFALSLSCKKLLLPLSCLSLRQSVRMEHLGSHWRDFYEFWYLRIFSKIFRKIQALLKSDKMAGTLLEDRYTFLIISCSVLLRMRNISAKFVVKIKTRILWSVSSFLQSLTKYSIMLQNTVERGRPLMIIWLFEVHAGYRRLQTHTHNMLCLLSTATLVARIRLIVILCVHCLSC